MAPPYCQAWIVEQTRPRWRRSESNPPLVNSRITLRTWLASVSQLAAIDGADTPALEPNTIDARPRVDACFARFASRLSRIASSYANGLTTPLGDASPPPKSRCNPIRHQQRVSGQPIRESPLDDGEREPRLI